MKSTFRIAEIGFGFSHWDASFDFEYKGRKFEVHRYGANFSVDTIKALIGKLRSEVDAFSFPALPPNICLDQQSFVHRQYFEIMNTPSSVPLCDGTGLREICNIESLRALLKNGDLKKASTYFFPSGIASIELEEFLRHQPGAKVAFGDLYTAFGLPLIARPFPGLMSITKAGISIAANLKLQSSVFQRPWKEQAKSLLPRQTQDCQYVVADLPMISYYQDSAEIFKGKELIVWSMHPAIEKHLKQFNFKKIHNLFPQQYRISPFMNYALLESVLRLTHQKAASLDFDEWNELLHTEPETMDVVRKYSLVREKSSQVKVSQLFTKARQSILREEKPDFAFVVHALSHRDFERAPIVGGLIRQIPKKYHMSFDNAVSRLPAWQYGQIRNVVSESSGRVVNGIVYALWATPKVLKTQEAEITYAQIQRCCFDAAERGAKIMGLGAYTKVVGDSGVTINKNSPLPVTTGNSLSASATLWGLYEVVQKMQLLEIENQTGRVDGTAMVIGATGSIGKVSAKLMCLVFKKLILVAPRLERLEELKAELIKLAPQCEIIVSTDANELADQVDALVTATSAFDQKIIDIEKLKPGCVVCDCSRPLDFSKEDAMKRPDIIIMESGELLLPGPAKIDVDLGLPGDAVYACLAETCVLALEEKYESFTLGRDIDWMKVKEIYRLSKKHGIKLASIQGHMGTLTDREIALTRELALARLKQNRKRG